jgi:hypothetical protein
VAVPEPQRERLLAAVEEVLTEINWGEYGVDNPSEAFVDETVDGVGERIASDAESESRSSDTASPEGTESAPGLGPGIDDAAERGYNFEQPGAGGDADDRPEITSASTVRDLIDDADLSTAQMAALVEYLQAEYLEEDGEE